MSDVYDDTYYDLPDLSDGELDRPLPTYDKNHAEKTIAQIERALKLKGSTMSEEWKERIRKSYRYVED